MSKYTQDKNHIYYKNTNIPINKLDIRNLKILEEEERKLLLKGYAYFHKKLSTFCQVRFLEQTSKEIFHKLASNNYLKDYASKTKEEFARKIAFFICELIALHPFFELNGRITRLFFDMIATYNGYEYIDYQDALVIEDGENKFIKASIDCMIGNDNEMYQIIFNGLKKSK